MKNPALSGQTLTEYALAASLVAVVAIGALTFMANDLSASLPGLLDRIFDGNANTAAPGEGGGSNVMLPASARNLPEPVPGETENVCFEGGLCLNLPVMAAGSVTETAGGLGGDYTRELANVLLQIAEHLREEGADDALVKLITSLANKGHDIGDLESLYETALPSIGDTHNTTLGATGPIYNYASGIHDNREDFENILRQVQDRPDVPPIARAIIDLESKTIVDIANGIRTPYGNGFANQQDPNAAVTLTIPPNAAEITHHSSDTICDTGGRPQCLRNKGNGWTPGG